jgi:hypothetical protein
VRLRPLTEAECYARIYGDRRAERAGAVRVLRARAPRDPAQGERLRARFEERLDAHGPEVEAA